MPPQFFVIETKNGMSGGAVEDSFMWTNVQVAWVAHDILFPFSVSTIGIYIGILIAHRSPRGCHRQQIPWLRPKNHHHYLPTILLATQHIHHFIIVMVWQSHIR
jgi:hypothetical protein